MSIDQAGLTLRQIAARGYCDEEDLRHLRENMPVTVRRLVECLTPAQGVAGLMKLARDRRLTSRQVEAAL
jgi:hypothetical protein